MTYNVDMYQIKGRNTCKVDKKGFDIYCRYMKSRFESMSFVVNILACKLKIVNNRN